MYHENKIKKTQSIYNNIKIIKSLVINLTKEVQESCTENYNTSLKETKDDLVKWTGILCSWIRKFNFNKMAILYKTDLQIQQ